MRRCWQLAQLAEGVYHPCHAHLATPWTCPTSPATQLQGPLLHPRTLTHTHTQSICGMGHATGWWLVAGGWRQQQLTRWQAINKPPVQMYLQSKYELRIRHVCYVVVFYPPVPCKQCSDVENIARL